MMWLKCIGSFLVLVSVLDASQREVTIFTKNVALNRTSRNTGVRAVSDGTLQQLLVQVTENRHSGRHLQYDSSDLRPTILRRHRRHRSRNGLSKLCCFRRL